MPRRYTLRVATQPSVMNKYPRHSQLPERVMAVVIVLALVGFVFQRLGEGWNQEFLTLLGTGLLRPFILWGSFMALAFIAIVTGRIIADAWGSRVRAPQSDQNSGNDKSA